jgi:RHH-type proline utilization regulon transcriptional repressor/proline dehydrogenase/delta 1-pyrroline-5-carboxylate dehydrogenase
MRLMGEQFVAGRRSARRCNGRPWRRKGFRYSYDMLGEAAVTRRRPSATSPTIEHAIRAIGQRRRPRLSGPRHLDQALGAASRATRAAVERGARASSIRALKALALLARSLDIGLNIDAEEADRLELSLDLLERSRFDPGACRLARPRLRRPGLSASAALRPRLARSTSRGARRGSWCGWSRAPTGTRDQARAGRRARRLPGLYAQESTPTSPILPARANYLRRRTRCSRKFATHNALTLATIHGIGSPRGHYEFQCLHGMGESLYEEVVGRDKLDVPCRIYAPVGNARDAARLSRARLLENGANTSFVHQIADPGLPRRRLLADPVERSQWPCAEWPAARPHRPAARLVWHAERANSTGFDISNEHRSVPSFGWRESGETPGFAGGPARRGDRRLRHRTSLPVPPGLWTGDSLAKDVNLAALPDSPIADRAGGAPAAC